MEFYVAALDCVPVGVERELEADWLSRSVGVDVKITGRHLRLPGPGDDGPTLEVFHYEPLLDSGLPLPNRTGFGHIAFVVDDVLLALDRVLACGGSRLGEIATGPIDGAGIIELVYCRDPEGNVIELQRWRG